MYGRKKSKISKISMTVSAVFHIAAFIVFATVKFMPDKDVKGAEVGVAFVDVDKTRVMKRSPAVRPEAALAQVSRRRPAGPQMNTQVSYRASGDFYVTPESQVSFSEVRSIAGISIKGESMQRPTVNVGKNMAAPATMDLRPTSSTPVNIGSLSGDKLIGAESSSLAKPDMQLAVNSKNVLQNFLKTVRKKIESSKRYPSHARDAGLEGRSGVRLIILKDGQLEKVEIMESSGSDILDNAALQSVRNSVPFPPIPELVKRDKIELSIYLIFKISET